MRVRQLINNNGNPAANQFVIQQDEKEIFQSYETKICEVRQGVITLDTNAMNYSNTTNKHLYIFLGMNRKEIEKGIKAGEIKVKNLNP